MWYKPQNFQKNLIDRRLNLRHFAPLYPSVHARESTQRELISSVGAVSDTREPVSHANFAVHVETDYSMVS